MKNGTFSHVQAPHQGYDTCQVTSVEQGTDRFPTLIDMDVALYILPG